MKTTKTIKLNSDCGASIAEIVLLLLLIAVTGFAAVKLLGGVTDGKFDKLNEATAATCGPGGGNDCLGVLP